MSRNNDSLPMLPPWLAESEGGGAGYEAPVQNLPHEDLIDDSPRRKEKKKRKGLFGRDKDTGTERGSEWGQPQQLPDAQPAPRPQPAPDPGPNSWSQPGPDTSRDPWGQQPGGPVAPPTAPGSRPEDVRPSGPVSRETAPPPGLPIRQPGEYRGSFQPLGQPSADSRGGAPEPMASNEATTRYTRPEPDAPVAERPPLPEPPARLPEPPARLPEPPARLPEPPSDRSYPPGPPTDEQPSTSAPLPRATDAPSAGTRPELPGPPPGLHNPESSTAPPASGGRPPLPEPPSATGDQRPRDPREVDGPPPWLAGPSDPGHLGLDPQESQPDSAQSGPVPRGRHWLPADHVDNAQPSAPVSRAEQPWNPPPFSPPATGEQGPSVEQPGAPGVSAPGDQRGPDGRRIPGAFAPPAAAARAPISDQLAPGERRDPGVFNQPPSQPFTGQPGTPNAFAPSATGQPAPGERRDPGLYDQPHSGNPADPNPFAPNATGHPTPGERRDPGLYEQPHGGNPGDPNPFAPGIAGHPDPDEGRDPGRQDQPLGQSSSGSLGDPNALAPNATGHTAPDQRRDPGLYEPHSSGQPGEPNASAPAPIPAERRGPGLHDQPPSGRLGDPNAFAPGTAGQPNPGERRDAGLHDQPSSSGQAGSPGTFAPGDQRAPVGDQHAPGERRDPGLFNQPSTGQPGDVNSFAPQRLPAGEQPGPGGHVVNQPPGPPLNGQPGPGTYAAPATGLRAPVGDQPGPGERRDPGVFNQPPNQSFTGQPYAPPATGQHAPGGDQPAPGEHRGPGVFNQPPNQPFTGQPGGQPPGAYPPGQPGAWEQGPNQQQWQQGPGVQPQGGQWGNGPRPNHGGPQPSLDDVPLRRAKKAPGGGWRKAVHHISGGTINPGMSAEELRLQELVARIRQPVRGDYRIAVLSLKGGVGKTTTTMGLGSIFASIRGDRVIAVDANPDFGTLSQRVPLQTRSTVRDLLLDPNVERYSDVRKHTSQATSRLEVLASERDPAASEQFDEHEYRAVARILQRYYNIILTDCGTGLTHSAMSGVLDLAHSLVLISSAAIDGARSAAATLDWLSLHGHDHLVRNAVVVINLPREGSVNVGIQQLREYFLSRCRAVHIIPFDDHLSEGAEIDLHRLSKQAKRAYVELAATVADEFNLDHRRYH